jgi:hypothetical protein
MWKVYADTFRIATRLIDDERPARAPAARRRGWLARVIGRAR